MKKQTITPQTTVMNSKQFLKENYIQGAICPCCSQPVKMYYRSITSAMAYGLMLMCQNNTLGVSIHIEDFFKKIPDLPSSIRGDLPKLKYWGLIKEGGVKGWYTVTEAGLRFVQGKTTVPSHVQIYNNKFYGFVPDKSVNIQDCLKNKFNLSKLMENVL